MDNSSDRLIAYEASNLNEVLFISSTIASNNLTGSLQTFFTPTVADGNVRIESAEQLWVGEHIRYNFKTHVMQSAEFRTGKWPVFMNGHDLAGNSSNKVYCANDAFLTTDDVTDPEFRVHATRILIIPGKLHRTLQLLSVHPFEKMPLHELFTETEFSAPPTVGSNQLLLLDL